MVQNASASACKTHRLLRNETALSPTILTSPNGSTPAFSVTSSNLPLHHLLPHEQAIASNTHALHVAMPLKSSDPCRPWSQWIMLSLIAASIVALGIALVTHFGWAGLQESLERLDPLLALAAMALLPLFGFSIAVVYVVAGAKFGFWMGGLAIAGITAFHLGASHWIARSFLRAPLQRLAARYQRHLPEFPKSEERSIAVMAALIPGPPYFARNYLLALTEIPLRVYFWTCLPIYVLRSYVTLALGDLSRDLTGDKLLVLVGIYVVKLAICGYLLQRLRRRLRGTSPLRGKQ